MSTERVAIFQGGNPTRQELEASIADTVSTQKEKIQQAMATWGDDPNNWHQTELGIVAVKFKHIAQERHKQFILQRATTGTTPRYNQFDMLYWNTLVPAYGDDPSVDDWPFKYWVQIATMAMEHYGFVISIDD